MQWLMAGAGLAAVLAWSARDLGRAARTSAPALATLRLVGGLGLLAMAAEALVGGFPAAAGLAALAAAPLLAGLVATTYRARKAVRTTIARPPRRERDPALERRAA